MDGITGAEDAEDDAASAELVLGRMLIKLFPIIPKESSAVSTSCLIEVAREGDRGRVEAVNNPLMADTAPVGGGLCEVA